MSITIKNGSITLKNLAELGSVLDPQTLPPGPEVADSQPTSGSEVTQEAGAAQTIAPHNLASLLAQLSTISTGLDAMARQDAYARDQAALDLARYEALLVDKQEAERALAEVRRLRAAAEQLSAEAFTDEARAQAAQHAAGARAAELNVTQLLADRTRELEELAARPHLRRPSVPRRSVRTGSGVAWPRCIKRWPPTSSTRPGDSSSPSCASSPTTPRCEGGQMRSAGGFDSASSHPPRLHCRKSSAGPTGTIPKRSWLAWPT